MDEKNLSPQKEDISESYNEIFDYNTINVESEMMNRDYLHHIYDEDMDSLSKVTLLTRTQHLRRVEETKQSFEKEINWSKKLVTVSAIILAVFIGTAISFYAQGLNFYEMFLENMGNIKSYNNGEINGYSMGTLKGMWQIFGLSGMAGSLFLLVGGFQFYLLGYGNIKRMRNLKKTREKALEKLEEIKKENMLMGTYDASK